MEPKSTAGSSGGQRTMDRNVEGYGKAAHQAVDRASEAASQVAGRMGEQYEALAARGEEIWQMKDEYVDTARTYVREHPFQALGMAVAAGFVLSMLMRSGK